MRAGGHARLADEIMCVLIKKVPGAGGPLRRGERTCNHHQRKQHAAAAVTHLSNTLPQITRPRTALHYPSGRVSLTHSNSLTLARSLYACLCFCLCLCLSLCLSLPTTYLLPTNLSLMLSRSRPAGSENTMQAHTSCLFPSPACISYMNACV